MQWQSPPPRAGEGEGGDKSCSLKPEAPSSPSQAPTRPCGSPALLQLTGGPCQRGPTCHSPGCHRPSEGGQAPASSGTGLYAHTAGACRAEAVGSHGQGRVECWFQAPLVPLGVLGASPRARLGLRIIPDSGSRAPPPQAQDGEAATRDRAPSSQARPGGGAGYHLCSRHLSRTPHLPCWCRHEVSTGHGWAAQGSGQDCSRSACPASPGVFHGACNRPPRRPTCSQVGGAGLNNSTPGSPSGLRERETQVQGPGACFALTPQAAGRVTGAVLRVQRVRTGHPQCPTPCCTHTNTHVRTYATTREVLRTVPWVNGSQAVVPSSSPPSHASAHQRCLRPLTDRTNGTFQPQRQRHTQG